MNKILIILFYMLFIFNCMSQWQFVGLLTGTGSNYPSVSVVSDTVVWVAGGNSGTPVIWRSTNGSAFSAVSPPPCFELTCIHAVSAVECFVGDGGSSGYNSGNAKLFRTTNAGANWTLVNQTGGANGFFLDVAFSNTSETDGIAVSNPPAGMNQPYYLLKTTDGGNNWIVQNPPAVTGSSGVWHCVFIYDAVGYGFSITGGIFPRIYGTTTGGSSWQTLPLLISGTPVTSFAFSDLNPIAIASTPNVVARTTDQGLSWQTVNNGGALCIRWITGTNTCYFMSGNVIKKSTDEGATWSSMTIGGGVSSLKHFDFASDVNTAYGYAIAGNGSVIKLTDVITSIKHLNGNVPEQFELYQNYPNPFNPVTKIRFAIPLLRGVPEGRGVLLKVYDILGQEVTTLVDDNLQPGYYDITWNAANYSGGVYYYRLVSGEFTKTIKMILVK